MANVPDVEYRPEDREKWIRRGDAARLLGKSRQTVSNLVVAGKVRSLQTGGPLSWRLFFLPDLEKLKQLAVFDSN